MISKTKEMVLKIALVLTVVSHYALLITLLLSVPMLYLNTAWYVFWPMASWLMNLVTMPPTALKCPLTLLENRIRIGLGWEPIRGFVGYWILFRRNYGEGNNKKRG